MNNEYILYELNNCLLVWKIIKLINNISYSHIARKIAAVL